MVNSVLKAVRILEELAESDNLGITELSSRLGLAKSTTHAILTSLESRGLVERAPSTQKFHLGTKLIELGNSAQHELDIYRTAHPFLDALNKEVDETVHLTVLDNDEVLYVDCIESRKRLRTYSVIGVRGPLHCTSVGKAMLAYLPESDISRIVQTKGLPRFTPNTITDEAQLRAELDAIRERGYAVDNAEHEEHLRCIGTPIRSAGAQVFASISISGPSQRITEEMVPTLAAPLMQAAAGISARLGYDTTRRTTSGDPTEPFNNNRRSSEPVTTP